MSNPSYPYNVIENYIYIYQLDKYVIVPVFPESLQDTLGSTFSPENILARTAPIFTYSNSGPRTMQINFDLHRDMMNDINYSNINFIDEVGKEIGDDYIDTLIRYLQAMALPSFSAVDLATDTYNSMINPPLIACKFGRDIFIKGIVDGDVSVTYSGPISKEGKYMQVSISFNIKEIEPQDAETIAKWGSDRGLKEVLTRGIYKSKS